MRKIKYICSLLICILLITGCGMNNKPEEVKTNYKINEEAEIDNFNIILNDVSETKYWNGIERENDTFVIYEFKITNISKSNLNVNSSINFKLIIDGVQYQDLNNNSTAVIQQNKSLIYQVVYDVPELDNYNLLFYSGIAANNITFETK